jgi:hypothetical protein
MYNNKNDHRRLAGVLAPAEATPLHDASISVALDFYSKNNSANITLSRNAERRPIDFRTGARSIPIRSIHALKEHRTCQQGIL